jgi:phosphosulfolactate synthase
MLLSHLPPRDTKPRLKGVNMVMDKGLSLREADDLMQTCGHLVDFLKLGFGTSVFTKNVKEKVKIYRDAGCKVYAGGTLFEAFVIRGEFEKYLKYIDELGLDAAEVSDGSIMIPHEEKCDFIVKLSRDRTVLSEVGAKEASVVLENEIWKKEMLAELQAGSSLVIAEARESGTVGIFNNSGKAETSLIEDILSEVPGDKVLWEAPLKAQQVWFINLLGAEVNLGNIAPADVIALETLRTGLRGDTFFNFLPQDLQRFKLKG